MQARKEKPARIRAGLGAFFAAALALFLLAGCARVRLDTVAMEPPGCLNDPVPLDALVLKHFRRQTRAHFGLFGLITWRGVSLQEIISEEREAGAGNGVINVTVSSRFGFWDVLFGLPLSPFWIGRTYVIEGDVVLLSAP